MDNLDLIQKHLYVTGNWVFHPICNRPTILDEAVLYFIYGDICFFEALMEMMPEKNVKNPPIFSNLLRMIYRKLKKIKFLLCITPPPLEDVVLGSFFSFGA